MQRDASHIAPRAEVGLTQIKDDESVAVGRHGSMLIRSC
jgi:hypothetical protein